MAEVTKSEVRNFTNISDTSQLSDSDLDDFIGVAGQKVSEDTQGNSLVKKTRSRLEMLYASHLVKLKMRGADAVIQEGDIKLEEIDAEAGTVYLQMYRSEIPSSKKVQFGHTG